MSIVILTILCLLAFAGGLVILAMMTPRILKRNFDEGLFLGIAAADIAGGLLVFAPVGIMFAEYNGSIGVRILDFIMLAIIAAVSMFIAIRSFRPAYTANVVKVSSVLAGSYCLLLLLAALYVLLKMFVLP